MCWEQGPVSGPYKKDIKAATKNEEQRRSQGQAQTFWWRHSPQKRGGFWGYYVSLVFCLDWQYQKSRVFPHVLFMPTFNLSIFRALAVESEGHSLKNDSSVVGSSKCSPPITSMSTNVPTKGDREIRQTTKWDLGRYWTSFNVTGIKMIPVSREVRIYRSPQMNVEFSKICLYDVSYIVCTYYTTKDLIYLFAPYYFFVNPITNKSASRNAKNERFRRAPPPISFRPIKRLKRQKNHLQVSPQYISCTSLPECWHYFWRTTSDFWWSLTNATNAQRSHS